jgi:hypothetical protein
MLQVMKIDSIASCSDAHTFNQDSVSLSGRGHGGVFKNDTSSLLYWLYWLRDDLPSLNAQGHSTVS